MQLQRGLLIWLVVLGLFALLLPQPVSASGRLTVTAGSIKTDINKTFTVNVNLSSDEAVNSASGQVIFPGSLLQATAVSQSGSIFSLWPEPPSINGESINFAGGMPSPGYTGTGKLFSITFKAKAAGTANISIANGKTLANNASATNVYAGSSGSVVTISKPVTPLTISSSTHPDQGKWYKDKSVSLSWNKPSGATSFSYSFGTKSGTTKESSISFPDTPEGKWTFDLSTHATDGDLQASYAVQIDLTPPVEFPVKVVQSGGNTDPFPVLSYEATDALSGIDHYEIIIDASEPLSIAESSTKLARQQPGTHHFKVRAFDKAGNVTEVLGQFEVQGFPGPVITEYPHFVSVLQPIVFKGTALLGSKVKLYVEGKEIAEFVVRESLTDSQRQLINLQEAPDDQVVEWTYTYKGVLFPGKHLFYAIQVKADTSESNRSNEAAVTVLSGSVVLGSITLPMALIAILLLIILLGATPFFFFIWKRAKRRFASVAERMRQTRHQIDKEFADLERDIDKDLHKAEIGGAVFRQVEADIEDSKKAVDQKLDSITKNSSIPPEKSGD
ncbi:MAG: hypothetical protein HZB70_04005 [Candidatus Berkelbacteria bacterium]|nr:MAG: hypothetical protein HZB70_04005 [Candidatus Berkelbacteria bacterium]QQG51536.1 MAG: hypothetical protein HY845_03185 [Candidatus Berkelbacteria bacterium]